METRSLEARSLEARSLEARSRPQEAKAGGAPPVSHSPLAVIADWQSPANPEVCKRPVGGISPPRLPKESAWRSALSDPPSQMVADVTTSAFGSSGAPKAYILAPSDGPGNDNMRAMNGGARLGERPGPPKRPGLEHSVSEPSLRHIPVGELGGAGGPSRASRFAKLGSLVMKSSPSSPSLSGGEKTPRTLHGNVRKASMVNIAAKSPFSRRRINASQSAPASPASPSSPSRVTFQTAPNSMGDGLISSRDEEGARKLALTRSKSLMSSLFELRRAAAEESNNPSTKEMTLMAATLSDLKDSEAQLRRTEALLLDSHSPVAEFGGKRFATTIISQRSLSVVSRKADLIKTADDRAKAFEEAHSRREEICEAMMDGECEIPEPFIGMTKFIASLVHRDGNPADADKSNFEIFASSFGLPAKHQALETLRSFEVAAVEWWCWRTLREAQCGANSDAIQRMIAVVVAVCGEQRHPALAEVETILIARVAEKVLENAEKFKARDAQTVERSSVPQPGSAREAADAIRDELQQGIKLGVPAKHPFMERAKGMEVSLRAEEKNRFAAKVLLAAQAVQEEDAKAAAEAAPSVAPVGPATERAETIEKTIEIAVSRDGVQEMHPDLKDARGIAAALRALDGDRKRLAAREKRLAKQNAPAK